MYNGSSGYGGGSCYYGGGGYNRGQNYGGGQYNFMGTGGGYKQFGSWKDRTGQYQLELEQKERELAAQKEAEAKGEVQKKREEKYYDKNLDGMGHAKVKAI